MTATVPDFYKNKLYPAVAGFVFLPATSDGAAASEFIIIFRQDVRGRMSFHFGNAEFQNGQRFV